MSTMVEALASDAPEIELLLETQLFLNLVDPGADSTTIRFYANGVWGEVSFQNGTFHSMELDEEQRTPEGGFTKYYLYKGENEELHQLVAETKTLSGRTATIIDDRPAGKILPSLFKEQLTASTFRYPRPFTPSPLPRDSRANLKYAWIRLGTPLLGLVYPFRRR